MQNMSRFCIIFCGVFTLTQDAYSISIKMHYCTQSEQHCVLLSECSNSRSLITSKQAELCGFHDEINENQKICCNSTNIVKNRNSAAVVLQKCREYSKYRYEQKGKADEPSLTARIRGGTPTQVREYPHMALIGYEVRIDRGPYSRTLIQWNCGGSLISENFVMSAAHCVHELQDADGPPQWVLLGELDKPATWSPFYPYYEYWGDSSGVENPKYNESAYYRIIKIHEHPNYNTSSLYNNIVLFELNTTVRFSPRVRPACLYTSTTDLPINTKAIITGWGANDTADDTNSRIHEATTTIVDPENCDTSYPPNSIYNRIMYDPKTMICAEDFDNGTNACEGDTGGPLQISMPERAGMWNIIGVISFSPCLSHGGSWEDPSLYTKVSHYLDWIQSIVWP
ncbi:serine protease persephone-like isoform X2 [Planococcus citri]|uniref:serine protease persephone-like isoform X2 n=1 Tax=Planococcus citri TaxID=170843 RepID=UPI0031F7B94B